MVAKIREKSLKETFAAKIPGEIEKIKTLKKYASNPHRLCRSSILTYN